MIFRARSVVADEIDQSAITVVSNVFIKRSRSADSLEPSVLVVKTTFGSGSLILSRDCSQSRRAFLRCPLDIIVHTSVVKVGGLFVFCFLVTLPKMTWCVGASLKNL